MKRGCVLGLWVVAGMLGCSKAPSATTAKTSAGAAIASGPAVSETAPEVGEANVPARSVSLVDWEPERALKLRLWHTYMGKERRALEAAVARFNRAHPRIQVVTTFTPYDSFENKLRITITEAGHGPDLFIEAHDKLGSWVASDMVASLKNLVSNAMLEGLSEFAGQAMVYKGNLYGLPLAVKPLAIYFNKKFVKDVPDTMEGFVGLLNRVQATERRKSPETPFYGLAYEAGNLFFHGQWLHAFGGHVLDGDLRPQLDSKAQMAALAFARSLHQRHGLVPLGIDGNMLKSYFNNEEAAAVISGPWLRSSILPAIDYGVAKIPTLAGKKAKPFVTVEGVFVSKKTLHPFAAAKVALFLAQGEAAKIRAEVGLQVVAHEPTLRASSDAISRVFSAQAKDAVLLDARPQMSSAIWAIMNSALTAGVFSKKGRVQALLTKAQEKAVLELRKHTSR